MVVVGAGDVARAARARTALVDGRVHGGDDVRVLAHAEIVVGAPDGHLSLPALMAVHGAWIGAFFPLKIGENSIVAFGAQRIKLGLELGVEIHCGGPPSSRHQPLL